MEPSLFSPQNLTLSGALLFLITLLGYGAMTGRFYSRRSVEDMRKEYDARIAQEHEMAETWRKAYERELAAKELRWNGVGQMMLEATKTMGHALESIQDEAKNANDDEIR
jgi:hypothetical protein